tara:strand:- start:121 stop:534 length:414 start_codon:yes stop_codon:yes gene_type:complete
MNATDAAYIAGLFDGEGCITCKKRKTKRKDRGGKVYNQWYIRCEMSMTDKEVIEWVHETLGFGWCKEKIIYNKPTHYKRQWRWSCGYRDALTFAKLIWPYTQVKLHKIEQIIYHYEPDMQDLDENIVDLASERERRI